MGVVDRSLRLITGNALVVPLVVMVAKVAPMLTDGLPSALIASFYLRSLP
jgi:hypothetical protein